MVEEIGKFSKARGRCYSAIHTFEDCALACAFFGMGRFLDVGHLEGIMFKQRSPLGNNHSCRI